MATNTLPKTLSEDVINKTLDENQRWQVTKLLQFVRSDRGFKLAKAAMLQWNAKNSPHTIEHRSSAITKWVRDIRKLARRPTLSQLTEEMTDGLCELVDCVEQTELREEFDDFTEKYELNVGLMYVALVNLREELKLLSN